MEDLKDVQSEPDFRDISIDKAGVKDIRYPIVVLDRENGTQATVASINMFVELPRHFKGTHMSRFVEILNEHHVNINLQSFISVLDTMMARLDAESAHLEIEFPYFIKKRSPVTSTPGLMEYYCRMLGSTSGDGRYDQVLEVSVPVTTVCPCSKEISNFGAHNQRGLVKVAVRFKRFIWIEDIIEIVEDEASCDVFSVLKRPDEKYVTERAYENPKFVEDMVRDVAKRLKEDDNLTWFSVDAENFESIHNHSAYAHVDITR